LNNKSTTEKNICNFGFSKIEPFFYKNTFKSVAHKQL
jgi:hypothetical protein